jgi:hypothetical protein
MLKYLVVFIIIAGVSIGAGKDCETALLEQFLIPINEKLTILAVPEESISCVVNTISLATLQQAKAKVDNNTTLVNQRNITAYAKEIQRQIELVSGKKINLWIADYPSQIPLVGSGKSIAAGQTIPVLLQQTTMGKNGLVASIRVDNINPPWMGIKPPFDIENNGIADYDTMEVLKKVSVIKVNSLKLIA